MKNRLYSPIASRRAAVQLRRLLVLVCMGAGALALGCQKKSPDDLLKDADTRLRSRDILGAELKYEEFLNKYPNDPNVAYAHFCLAACFWNDKDYDRTREQLAIYIKLEGGPQTQGGYMAFRQILQTYLQQDQPKKALETALATSDTLRALPTENEKRDYLLLLCEIYLRDKQSDKAIQICEDLINQGPSVSERHLPALERLGAIYDQMGKKDQAAKVFEDYLQKYPDCPFKGDILFSIGYYRKELGEEAKAGEMLDASENAYRQQLEKAVNSDEKIQFLMRIHKIQYFRKNFAGAEKTLQSIIDDYPIHPMRPLAVWYLAALQMEQGKVENAIKNYQRIADEYPNTPLSQQATTMIQRIKAGPAPTTGTLEMTTTGTLGALTTGTLPMAPILESTGTTQVPGAAAAGGAAPTSGTVEKNAP